jgi:CheY-like chemotaxis protein
VHLPDGSAVYTYTDVTDRKAAEVAKDNFLATMSHEIRTPLTGLLGMADLMSHEILTSKQRGYLASIQSSGRHLLAIVNDILDFSRIEASKLKLEQVEFSISALMEDIGRLMKPQAEERGLRLAMTSTGALPAAIVGDPTRLAQVLLNLIGNGIKFTDSGEVAVQLSCSRVSDELVRIRFDVVDTGCGIDEEVRSELFNPFVQSDNSPTRQHGGSGLGLAISQRLVELMGDTIRIESSVGHGSRFWFEMIARVGSAVTRVGAVGVGFVDQYPARILVAEDVEVNRRVIAEILRRCGHEITLAVDGREAVELALGGQFDAILLDIQMPIMDGVEAARRIRAHFGVKGGPRIIGLTAFALPDRIQSYLAAGLDECLLKPIDWDALFAAIARATRVERSAVLQCHVLHPMNSYEKVSLPVSNSAGDLENPFFLPGGEELVEEVLRDADHILTTLASLPVGSVQFAELVHKLKGTTGLVGLRRASDLTERLLTDGCDEGLAAQVLAEIRESLAGIARQLRLSDVLEDV